MPPFENQDADQWPLVDRASRLAGIRFDRDQIDRRTRTIHEEILKSSPLIREPNFDTFSANDLAYLFKLYDRMFFERFLDSAVSQECPGRLEFRISKRMTKVAGKTTRFTTRPSQGSIVRTISLEIAISSELLFRAFGRYERPVVVCGRPCANRLEALQRVFEHELIHLVEFLVWRSSNCSAGNFQDLVGRIFAHEDVRHELATVREIAAEFHGVRVGDTVSFEFEGQVLVGRLNRITKRGSVLVEDPSGVPYNNGRRYLKYYVPVAWLVKV